MAIDFNAINIIISYKIINDVIIKIILYKLLIFLYIYIFLQYKKSCYFYH